MMRLKSVSTISLIVIVACGVWLVAVPTLRESIRQSRMPVRATPLQPRLEQQIKQRPHDAQAWFAFAIVSEAPESKRSPDMAAFQRVFDLKPKWAAPYLALGGRLTSQVPEVWRSELAAFNPDFAAQAKRQRTPLTAKQRETIRRARQVLDKARSLDPANAAPDYLLAFLALMEHRDHDALALLRAGLARNHWSLGQREARIAVYRIGARSLPAVQAFSFTVTALHNPSDLYPRLRELGRIVTGMAVLAERRGDVEGAVFLRRSMLHLGRLMIEQGYTTSDVLVGTAMWNIAASERLTPAEEAAVLTFVARQKRTAHLTETHLGSRAIAAAKREKVARYMREHERADLAEYIISYGSKLTAWVDRMRETLHEHWSDPWYRWGYTVLAFGGVASAGGVAVIGLLLCAASRLLLGRRGGWPPPITWARWKWALVVVACLAVPFGAMTWATARYDNPEPYAPSVSTAMSFGTFGLVAGVLLLAIASVMIVWRARRRVARHERPGFGRQYAATLTAALLPTTAVLLLAAVGLSYSVISQSRRFTRDQQVMIYQGELQYLGLKPPG
jgi:hypothetical protein